MYLPKSTWAEIQGRLKTDIVLLPIGSMEQHGLHLPLDTDSFIAVELSKRIAAAAEKRGIHVIRGAPIIFGISGEHMKFAGTISLTPEIFMGMVKNICESFIKHECKKIVLVNGHVGNSSALSILLNELKHEHAGCTFVLLQWWEIASDVIKKNIEVNVFHACEIETSLSLSLGQEVRKEKIEVEMPPTKSKFIEYTLYPEKPQISTGISFKEISKTGTIGDPTKASKEKGDKIVNLIIDRSVELLKEIKEGKLS